MLMPCFPPPSKRALGRGNLVLARHVERDRGTYRARQSLEAGFGDVMAVCAVKRLDMQRDASIHRESLKEFPHQLGIELANLRRRKIRLEDEEGPARDIDRDARQRLVHGQMHVAVAADALPLAERLP